MTRRDPGNRRPKRIKLEENSDVRFSSQSITPRTTPEAPTPLHDYDGYIPLFGKKVHYSEPAYVNSLERQLRRLNWTSRTRFTLRKNVYTNLRPWKSFDRTSGDVIVTKWHPNGENYAVGSSTSEDASSEAYNKPLNLVYGNIVDNTLHELDDHHVWTSDTLHDNRKYNTISDIAFHPKDNGFLTSAYDNTVKIWSTRHEEKPICRDTLRFTSRVELLATHDEGSAFAVCQRDSSQGISIFGDWNAQSTSTTTLSDPRVGQSKLLPAALKFGHAAASRNYLLAGFAQEQSRNISEPVGLFAIWDLARSEKLIDFTGCNQAVFDVCWRPTSEHFAVATNKSGLVVEKHRIGDVRSHVRTYAVKDNKKLQEFDCPAVDINIVQFHPTDPNILVAAATNRSSYVWDRRRGDAPLLELKHDQGLEEVDNLNTFDTGVRFLAFSPEGHTLYTGSSDGVLKHWDIYASPEDCHIRDVATFTSGIMAGAFSPDFSNLIVGTVQGEVHLLSCAPPPMDEDDKNDNKIRCVAARPVSNEDFSNNETLARDDSAALIAAGEVVMDPVHGPGRGPKATFFRRQARPDGADLVSQTLFPEVLRSQLDETLHEQGMRMKFGLYERGLVPPSLKAEIERREERKSISKEHYERRRPFTSRESQILNKIIARGLDSRAQKLIQADTTNTIYEANVGGIHETDDWGDVLSDGSADDYEKTIGF